MVGKRLLVIGRIGDEDSLVEVVARAVGLGQIAHPAVDLGAVAGHFRSRRRNRVRRRSSGTSRTRSR